MHVHVLHHGHCFDGLASACVFFAFITERDQRRIEPRFIPKFYGATELFNESDFAGDLNACVDFRYSQHPRLDWYFDHHRSAFQADGDLEHYAAHQDGRRFHDADAPSCARLIIDVAREQFGCDLSRFDELVDAADIIDRARFASPQAAIALDTPAMRVAAYVQTCETEADVATLVRALEAGGLTAAAKLAGVDAVVSSRQRTNELNLALLAQRARLDDGVVTYDLLNEGPRVLNHFMPYYLHPEVRYAVGAYEGADGSVRLTVGFNPWLDPGARGHDLASVCEEHGGGGHAYVGGCTLPPGNQARMREILSAVSRILRADSPVPKP